MVCVCVLHVSWYFVYMSAEFHEIGTPLSATNEWSIVDGNLFSRKGWCIDSMGRGVSVYSLALDGNLFELAKYRGFLDTVVFGSGSTVMHYAVAGGWTNVVEFLLFAMKRPHLPDKLGVCPLSLACRYGHLKVFTILLLNGGIISPDKRGNNALHECAINGQDHCLQDLLQFCTEKYPSMYSHCVWDKNIFGKTPFDLVTDSTTSQLLLSYMKK